MKRDGHYQAISWTQAAADVKALSAFLLSIRVNPGDRILLLSENRPEWGIADIAIQAVGAWTVPIYATLNEPDIVQIAEDCEPVVCVASTLGQAQKIRAVRQQLPSLRLVIVMDSLQIQPTERLWEDILREGESLLPTTQATLEQRMQQLRPQNTATLIYTSGTTGEPKGVMLSHENFLSNAAACLHIIPIRADDLHLSFLPLSHVFERMAGWYLMLMAGASVAYAESMDTIAQNMIEAKPSIMLSVPRVFEKFYARIQDGLRQASPMKQRIGQWALAVGQRSSRYRLQGRRMPIGLRLQLALAYRLVFHKIAQRLGGRLRFFVSGSAPLAKSIGEFFHSIGVTILEGYGLTETSPVISVNRLDALKFGSVGLPIEGVQVKIAEDGEILTKGPHIMQGYYHKPDETRAVLMEGWLKTGDIGSIDADGFLWITDRKKDLIKTAGGKFVAPQKLENLFLSDPYVAQVSVHGDRKPFCVALVVPNFQRLAETAAREGWPTRSQAEMAGSKAVHAFLWARLQALQQTLPSFEQVKAIAILDHEFTQAAGELTPTLKAKRAAIASRYQTPLEQLYQTP